MKLISLGALADADPAFAYMAGSGGGFPVEFLAFGFVIVAMGVVARHAAKKRREEFAAPAAAHGWTHEARNDTYTEQWTGDPFGRGHNRQAHNVLTGTHDGRRFTAFDYVYYTTETSTNGNGNSTRQVAHHYSVVALTVGTHFPNLTVHPEGAVGRFFGKITNRDIRFESDAFNRAFTVTCEDRKFASDVIHPRMMDVLLAHPNTAFRFNGDTILSIDTGKHSITEVTHRLTILDSVIDNIPDFVWKTGPGAPATEV